MIIVSSEVAKGIAAARFQTGVPVIFGILTADTMQQALERAGIKSNHGWDYAMSALEMASLMRQLRSNLTEPYSPQCPVFASLFSKCQRR